MTRKIKNSKEINCDTIVCPVCTTNDVSLKKNPFPFFRHLDFDVFEAGGGELGACNLCGIIFRITDSEEEKKIEDIYKSKEYLLHEEPHTKKVDEYYEPVSLSFLQATLLKEFLSVKNASVLDIGCFDGTLLKEISDNYNAIDLCGFDVAERPQFPKSGAFRFVSGEISDVEGEFDLITLSHSMQYIKDIVCLFEQINRLLKPCGKVFVQVPNYSLKPCSLLLGDLFYHYSEGAIVCVFDKYGFNVSIINSNWFPRDILIVAEKKQFNLPLNDNLNSNYLNGGIKKIERLASEIYKVSKDKLCVLGTTIEAAFVNHCSSDSVLYFIDENPRKVGKYFHGKLVIHPKDSQNDYTILIPMFEDGKKISERLSMEYKGTFRALST